MSCPVDNGIIGLPPDVLQNFRGRWAACLKHRDSSGENGCRQEGTAAALFAGLQQEGSTQHVRQLGVVHGWQLAA